MIKLLLANRSPAGAQAQLSVLIFHRVLPATDPLFPFDMTAHRFNLMCIWLKTWFNILPLDQAVKQLKLGTLPARAACLTFDDGYADNEQVALPILLRHGITASFFIATGFLDGGRMWNDTVVESIRRTKLTRLNLANLFGQEFSDVAVFTALDKRACIQSLISKLKYQTQVERLGMAEMIAHYAQVQPPTNLMMTSAQVVGMRESGMQIGAHTVSHPILAGLMTSDARREIENSKYTLEHLLGERVGLFAYPNGKPTQDYSVETMDLVRDAGFDAAVSTHHAAAGSASNLFEIPRYTPWERSRFRMGLRLLDNLKRKSAYSE